MRQMGCITIFYSFQHRAAGSPGNLPHPVHSFGHPVPDHGRFLPQPARPRQFILPMLPIFLHINLTYFAIVLGLGTKSFLNLRQCGLSVRCSFILSSFLWEAPCSRPGCIGSPSIWRRIIGRSSKKWPQTRFIALLAVPCSERLCWVSGRCCAPAGCCTGAISA